MKKYLISLLCFFALTGSALAASFPDVAEDHENYNAIERLDDLGIVKGYENGMFDPDRLVNRAEALKMILGALEVKTDGEYEQLFGDVKTVEWFFSYVMTANKLEIVKGYGDGNFKPGNPVTMAETLKMIMAAAKVELPGVTDDVFMDVNSEAWYSAYFLYARNKNIVLSDDYGNVSPHQTMTRAAFAEVIYRMMTVLEKNGEPFPLDLNWSLYESHELPFAIKYDDKNWNLVEHDDEAIFLKPDREFAQFSANRSYPNSAVLRVTVDSNMLGKSAGQYFANLKEAFAGAEYKEFRLGGLQAFEILHAAERMVDWYVYLEDGRVLVVYTQYGNGILGFQLQQVIKTMLGTLEFRAVSAVDYSDLLSQILEKVLVEGQGLAMLNLLPDKLIIETDAIGVGTGPVDYYYSDGVDYTFKYERASDVILDTKEGRTSAF